MATIKPRRRPRPRPKTRAEFFQREQEHWRELIDTWRGLSDEALLQPGACGPGWNMKDVMNHIATWLEVTQRVVSEALAGRHATLGHGLQRFNTLHYQTDRARSLAASRRRLNRSRRELLTLLERVPETRLVDLKGRLGWWVKYSTYAHYGEHVHELVEHRRRWGESEQDKGQKR